MAPKSVFAPSTPNSQATNNNNQATNNNQAPANNQNANPVSDIGQEKTVGKWTIQVNGVREYPGDDTSHPQNGKYIIVDAAVTNNSDQSDALGSSDVTLTDSTGRKSARLRAVCLYSMLPRTVRTL